MAQVWSIMINGNVPAKFNPDVFGTGPGEALKAQLGDLVSWNNQTNDTHQIAVAKPDGTISFTTEKIASFKSSTPGYVTAATDVIAGPTGTIYYYCTLHLDQNKKPVENGKITVVTS